MLGFRGRKKSQHDLELFRRGEEILPEKDFHDFVQLLTEERSFYSEPRAKVLAFLQFFEQEGSVYFSSRLQDALKDLLKSLTELRNLTSIHFLVFPRNQTGSNLRHTLHPDYFILEIDNVSVEEHDFYLTAERYLKENLARITKQYATYRRRALRRVGTLGPPKSPQTSISDDNG